MTPAEVRHALLQQLASLQRSGVSQLPRITASQLAALNLVAQAEQPAPEAAGDAIVRVGIGQSAVSQSAVSQAALSQAVVASGVSAGAATNAQPNTAAAKLEKPKPAPPKPVPQTGSPPSALAGRTPGSILPAPNRPAPRPLAASLLNKTDSAPVDANPSLSPEERRVALEVINSEVRDCTRCPQLVANRSRTVFGVGTVSPRLCFFGEAPGADEDRQGIPFVGRAGQLLDKIIEAMGLRREEVYILNVLKCRPPDNRAPQDDEIENCRGFFERQLAVLKPEFVCCLGASAAKTMLHSAFSLGKMRGRFYDAYGAQVIVTYHPAYLLRNPAAKKDTWEDIQMLMKAMGLTIPAKE